MKNTKTVRVKRKKRNRIIWLGIVWLLFEGYLHYVYSSPMFIFIYLTICTEVSPAFAALSTAPKSSFALSPEYVAPVLASTSLSPTILNSVTLFRN